MLKGLPIKKVNAALALLGPEYTTKTVTRLRIDANTVTTTDGQGAVTSHWERGNTIEMNDLGVSLIKHMYGGALDDVMALEVFRSGYLIETKTSVLDWDQVDRTHVREIRAGHLVGS